MAGHNVELDHINVHLYNETDLSVFSANSFIMHMEYRHFQCFEEFQFSKQFVGATFTSLCWNSEHVSLHHRLGVLIYVQCFCL